MKNINIQNKHIKTFIFIIAILVFLILVINLGLREIIKSESIRGKIIATISEKTESDVDFEEIEVYLIPTPHITVYNGSFSNKKFNITSNFESVDIYPKVISILKGELILSYIKINNPNLLIKFSRQPPDTIEKEPDQPSSFSYLFEKYYKDLITITSKLPTMNLQISKGKLELFEDGKEVLQLKEVNTRYEFRENLKYLKITGSTNFASLINFESTISPSDLKSSIKLYVKSLDPQIILSIFLNDSSLIMDNSEVDLGINLRIDGIRNISGDFRFPKFKLNLINKEDSFIFKGTNLNGNFNIVDDKQLFLIEDVNIINPKLNLSGEFQSDKKSEKTSLKIEGENVDIETTRQMALFSLNKYEITEKIFQVLKAGKFETVVFHSESEKFNELFKDENFRIYGTINKGDISVPKIELNLKNVSGKASIKDGVLYGNNLYGQTVDSIISNGTLMLGLGKDNDILKINTDIDGNLPEIHQYLIRFSKNEWFLKFLSSLENLKGNASGNLILGDKKSSIKAKVKVKKFDLTTNYPKIPDKVNLTGTELFYEESNIKFKNVKGSIADTTFKDITGKYNWGNKSHLEISNLKTDISIEEFYPWLSSFDNFFIYYLRNYKTAKGNINIKDLQFSRPVSEPENWNLKFKSEGTIYDEEKLGYSLNFTRTPGNLKIDNLKIKDENSDAELYIELNDKSYQIYYSGRMAEKTTDKFLTDDVFSFGWIEGDIRINYLKNEISKSTANGTLKGRKIVFPIKGNKSIKIDNISLNAKKNRINIETLNLFLEESELNISGSLNSDTDKIAVDFNASADEIELAELKKYFEHSENNKGENKESTSFPVEGKIKVDISKFYYGRLFWQPFQADINLSRGNVNIEVNNASICNVSTTGNLLIDGNNLEMGIDALSENKRIEESLNCFFNEKERVIGDYDFQADILSNGNLNNIRETLNGKFTLNVKDGTISKNNRILLTILKAANIAEIYRGKLPDFSAEGLKFSEIDIKGDIEKGVIKFNDATLEGPFIGMLFGGHINLINENYDIVFRVAVLKIVQDVVKKIPLVKRLKTQKITSIPVRVKGEFDKPDSIESYNE